MKHCCVIGGNGFIGKHLVKILLTNGRKVTVIDFKSSSDNSVDKQVNLFCVDYSDFKVLKNLLINVDEIVFLAYLSVPKTSYDDPVKDISDHLPKAVKLFELAKELPISKFIYLSSGGAVYGNPCFLPINEFHPTNPISPYGITKLAIEKYAYMFYKMYNFPIISIRPSNAYGENQQPYTGQGFLTTMIASIIDGNVIEMYGEDIIRDYIYVDDLAMGIFQILEKGQVGECYNVGSGTGRSNKDLINTLLPLAKSEGLLSRIKILPKRPFDVSANVLDCAKIKEHTGWELYTSFEKGITKTWRHFLEHHNH